jgi:hypothetical protein
MNPININDSEDPSHLPYENIQALTLKADRSGLSSALVGHNDSKSNLILNDQKELQLSSFKVSQNIMKPKLKDDGIHIDMPCIENEKAEPIKSHHSEE